jgi:hypothetical protein
MGNRHLGGRLDNRLPVERTYDADREAMLAALRVVLGLPKVPPSWLEGWQE